MKEIEGNLCQCSTCIHDSEPWDSDACDGCCGAHSSYEPIGEGITAEEAKKLGECFEEGFRKGLSNDRK